MTQTRRNRLSADVAVGYAADGRGRGIAYAAIATGSGVSTVRVPFTATALPALDGLDVGYAAVSAVGAVLKARGYGRVRIRVGDERVAGDLSGTGSPPRSLAMAYVKARCIVHGLGAVRIQAANAVEVRDLTARAQAEVRLNVAA